MNSMNSSILIDTKKYLGIDSMYEAFDMDVIMNINAAFAVLHQLGVGPPNPFNISGTDETWDEFSDDLVVLGLVKQYVWLSVRKLFDPPNTSFVGESITQRIAELEWRLNAVSDHAFKYYDLDREGCSCMEEVDD